MSKFKKICLLITSTVLAASCGTSFVSAEESFFFIDHFEDGNHSWTGRGAAKLQLSESSPYDGVN